MVAREEGWTGGAQRIFRAVKLFCKTLHWCINVIIHLPKPREYPNTKNEPHKAGLTTPGLRTGASPWPVRNWATPGGDASPVSRWPHLLLPIAHTITWTISPHLQSLRKMSSEPVPGARRLGTTAVSMDLKRCWCVSIGSLIINNGPLWCKMLIPEEGGHTSVREDMGTLCTSCCEPKTVLKMKVDYFREQFKEAWRNEEKINQFLKRDVDASNVM